LPRAADAPRDAFIMATALIDMISIGLIIPCCRRWSAASPARRWTRPSVRRGDLHLRRRDFFGSPILGALSDSFGRRPVLLIGFCGFALNFFLTALSTSLLMLVAVRLLAGAMQANLSVANAYVADITPPEHGRSASA